MTREVVNAIKKDHVKIFFSLGLDLFADNVSNPWDVRNNLGVTKVFQPWFSVH